MRRLIRTFALGLCAAAGAGPALAQETWRVVIPATAGGANDGLARMIAQKMGEATGNTTVVENIPGANGTLGTIAVTRALPDGKTMLFTSEAYATVNPIMYKTARYDASSLEIVRLIAVQPAVLAVSADSKLRTLNDLVQKGRGDGLIYASGGIGSMGHLTTELLASYAGGMKLTHVPYPGGAPAINAVIGAQVDAGFIIAGNVLPHVRSGKLRALAVSSPKRIKSLPDVPTVAELGYPEFQSENSVVLVVLSRTPQAVKDKLSALVGGIVENTPAIREHLEKNGYIAVNADPKESKKWLDREVVRWHKLLAERNITPD